MSHCPHTSSMRAHRLLCSCSLLFFFLGVLCPRSLLGGLCFQEARSEEEELTNLERLLQPKIMPRCREVLVMGITEGSPVHGEVDEADVGKTLCQHLCGGAELLEVNTAISFKYSSKAGEDCHPSFRSSQEFTVEVTQQIHVLAGLPLG